MENAQQKRRKKTEVLCYTDIRAYSKVNYYHSWKSYTVEHLYKQARYNKSLL